ncbi:hypothetical protein [Parasediminibacterium sp. JCM 36343]|uniref:hypothetical protein n=1 Tax=Parasediminibacterium sp. JCM 36343 TaxID=3374279 RepID=UPI0039793D83
MPRETQFYKLDKQKAQQNLFPYLTSKVKFKKTFEDFIIEQKLWHLKYEAICNFSSEIIIEKVHTDINQILPSELSLIIKWLDEIYDDKIAIGTKREIWEKIYYELYYETGITQLFRLISVDAYGFMFQYGNFSSYYELEGIEEDNCGENIKASYFTKFLDYILLLMKKIIDAKLGRSKHVFSIEESESLTEIEKNYFDDSLFTKGVNEQFNFLNSLWATFVEEELENDGSSISTRDPDLTTILLADHFLSICLDAKNSLTSINTNVLILDSL